MQVPENLVVRLKWRATRARQRGPSFSAKYAESRRVHGTAQREFGVTDPVWSVNTKRDAAAWVDTLGVRRPQVHGEFQDVRDVAWTELPDRVVVKPDHGAGGQGVHLLERDSGGWRDVLHGRVLSEADVCARLQGLADRGVVSRAVVAEQMVDDPQRPGRAPVDWKFYTFFGTVGLVLARAPRLDAAGAFRPGWRMFDGAWADLGEVYAGHLRDPGLAPPAHAAELTALAQRLSAAIPRPFLRVDLYDDRDGAVFGELTPQPGGEQRFRRDVDRRLGELWETSEARVFARAVAAGVFSPSSGPLPESALLLPGATPAA